MYTIQGEKRLLQRELIAFLILAATLSWSVIFIIMGRISPDFRRGSMEAVEDLFGNLPMLFGCGPMISALIVTAVYRRKQGLKEIFKKVVTWKVSPWWFLVALVVPIVPQWIGLLIWEKLTGVTLTLSSFTAYLSSWLQIALISALFFITEETGWRGFMLPRVLASNEWLKSALIVGVVGRYGTILFG